MSRLVILGQTGSGRNALLGEIGKHLPDMDLEVFHGAIPPDCKAGILVVSATDGPMPDTREHLYLSHQASLPNIFAFLNKTDLVSDQDLLSLVIEECKELANRYGYSEKNFMMATGSATQDKGAGELADLIRFQKAVWPLSVSDTNQGHV